MNTTIQSKELLATHASPAGGWSNSGRAWVAAALVEFRRRPELPFYVCILAALNWPVLTGSFLDCLVFRPGAVQGGEWWRLLTHAFVHATWYHLLLDGAAFLLLIQSLAEERLERRTSYVIAGMAGSLLASWWAAPNIALSGLCGLSGVAHGLTAVSAVEMIQQARRKEVRCGLIAFGLVVAKAALEALRGGMFFSFLHFGRMGDPVAVSHAGGVIGALIALLWFSYRNKAGPCSTRVC